MKTGGVKRKRRGWHEHPLTKERGRRATGLVGAASAALVTGAIAVQPAHAGTYVMRNCDVPQHGNSLMGPWRTTAEMAPNAVLVDACAAGGGVGFAFAPGPQQMPFGVWATLALVRPQTGPQSTIKLVKAMLWYAARLGGTGSPINLWSLELHSDNTTFVPGVSNGPPGAENLSFEQVFNADITNVYKVGVRCGPQGPPPAGASIPDCIAGSTMPLQIRGMEVTLSEDTQPVASPLGGTLLSDGPQSGVRTLSYAASDPQSGIAKVDGLIDGTVVATRDLTTTRCSYYDFSVCPTSDDGTFEIDTRAVPNGSHRLTVRVQDAAANERIVEATHAIEIANERAPLAPASANGSIRVGFKGSARSTLTVPYGRRVSLRGRLSGTAQAGLAATHVDVLATVDRRGAREVSVGSVSTRADGSFSYVLPARGPSRKLRLAYRPNGGEAVFSPVLGLRVRSGSSLRASLQGVVMRFSGRVRGAPIPKGGKRVLMEGRAPGSTWKVFSNMRTDRRGRFSGTYRLRVHRPGVVLKVRVVVPRENGYPYAGSSSRPATVRVR